MGTNFKNILIFLEHQDLKRVTFDLSAYWYLYAP